MVVVCFGFISSYIASKYSLKMKGCTVMVNFWIICDSNDLSSTTPTMAKIEGSDTNDMNLKTISPQKLTNKVREPKTYILV